MHPMGQGDASDLYTGHNNNVELRSYYNSLFQNGWWITVFDLFSPLPCSRNRFKNPNNQFHSLLNQYLTFCLMSFERENDKISPMNNYQNNSNKCLKSEAHKRD